MDRITNVLFDLDGTLTDPKIGITRCIQFALEKMGAGIPHADELHWCIGPSLPISFARLLSTSDKALIDHAVTHYRVRFSDVGLFENEVYPEIPAALERVRASGLRAFVATSKPHVFAGRIIDHFQLRSYFHSLHGSELDGTRSDKGELIAHLLATEGIDPAQTLMIGDREHDIFGARKNRIRSAAVTYGYGTREELTAAQPDFIFDSPLELAAFLERQPG